MSDIWLLGCISMGGGVNGWYFGSMIRALLGTSEPCPDPLCILEILKLIVVSVCYPVSIPLMIETKCIKHYTKQYPQQ